MILVTGATGFLGSELVRQLHSHGERIRAVKRRSSVIPIILRGISDIEWVEADLLDYYSMERAFEGATKVYHCAALVSFHNDDRKEMLRVNHEGTARIVDLCLGSGIEKLVHVSSVAALGEAKKGEMITEKNYWEFDGSQHSYSVSKYESEMEVWRGIAEGLTAVIVNPSVIIGKNAGDRGSGQIFETVRKGLKFYTGGTCGFTDAEDVARAMIMLMNSEIKSERFIVNSENVPFKELFAETAKCFGVKAPHMKVSPWMMEIAWRLAGFASLFTRKKYELTKDTARSSLKKRIYSSEKLLKFFPGFTFKPVKESIEEICRITARPGSALQSDTA